MAEPTAIPAAPPTRADLLWVQAAAFGALWGTVEITLGSFLHTLRVPFSGAILGSLSAALLAAHRQMFPVRGSSLAVSLVAALCKSLSPGGIILGPMLGILSEGVVMELLFLPAPRSLVACAAGGAICSVMASVQKVFVSYLVYGGTILELYLALLRKAGEWLGVRGGGWWFCDH